MVDEHSSVRWPRDADSLRLLPTLGQGMVAIVQGTVADLMVAFEILPDRNPYRLGSFWVVCVCDFSVNSTTTTS